MEFTRIDFVQCFMMCLRNLGRAVVSSDGICFLRAETNPPPSVVAVQIMKSLRTRTIVCAADCKHSLFSHGKDWMVLSPLHNSGNSCLHKDAIGGHGRSPHLNSSFRKQNKNWPLGHSIFKKRSF